MLAGSPADPVHRIWYVPWKIMRTGFPDEIIGEFGVKGPQKDGCVEIGYGMNPAYEGKGYMTETVNAAVQRKCGTSNLAAARSSINEQDALDRISHVIRSSYRDSSGRTWYRHSFGVAKDIITQG